MYSLQTASPLSIIFSTNPDLAHGNSNVISHLTHFNPSITQPSNNFLTSQPYIRVFFLFLSLTLPLGHGGCYTSTLGCAFPRTSVASIRVHLFMIMTNPAKKKKRLNFMWQSNSRKIWEMMKVKNWKSCLLQHWWACTGDWISRGHISVPG